MTAVQQGIVERQLREEARIRVAKVLIVVRAE